MPPTGLQSAVAEADAVVVSGWESPAYQWALLNAKARRKPCILFDESVSASHRFGRGPIAGARTAIIRAFDSILTPGVTATNGVLAMGVNARHIVTSFNAVDVAATTKPLRVSTIRLERSSVIGSSSLAASFP